MNHSISSFVRLANLAVCLHSLTAIAATQTPHADVVPIAPACGGGTQRLAIDFDQAGSAPTLRLSGPSNRFVFVHLGASDSSFLGVPLPLSLDSLGATGCSLYASGDVLAAPLLLAADGLASLPLPAIFSDPPVPVFCQALLLNQQMTALAGTSNAFAIDRGWATEYVDLPQRVMADFDAGRLPWRNLSAADIARFASAAHAPAESPQALTDWLRTYVAMDDVQLATALRAVQHEGFAAAGIQYLPEAGMTVGEIAAATDWIVAESRRRLGMPAHLAAIRGVPGIQEIMEEAFGLHTRPPINGCGDVSFPYLYSISYRLPRFGWSSSANLRRQGSSDGCFNYRHNFSHDIRNLTPTSPAALGMIGAHGLGWRLYGSDRSLYYRGGWASAFGITFVTMQASMQIRKR